jgi:hypothetical protein
MDRPGPADAGTAHERDIRWSGQHAIVTMPAEMDLANSSDVSDLLAAAARPSTASRACSAPARGVGFGVTLVLGGFPQDAPFGCGVEEIEHEPGDEFWVVGDGDVSEAVEPSELRVGDKRQEAGRLHADQGVGGSLHDQHGQVIRSRPVGMYPQMRLVAALKGSRRTFSEPRGAVCHLMQSWC